MSHARLLACTLLAAALLCVLVACAPRQPAALTEAEYVRARASFVERLLANDKASQRASIGPGREAQRELLRLAGSDEALADEQERLVPPERWRTDSRLLVKAARSLAAGMRGFADVAVRPRNESTPAVEAASKHVAEGQEALDAAQRIYHDLTSRPMG